MRLPGLVLPAICCVLMLRSGLAAPSSPQEEIQQIVPQARERLAAWHARNPEPGERKLHVVYWTPRDRDPAPRYRERLHAILEDIRAYYAREMDRLGFGSRTFAFDMADDGLIRIHLVKGLHDYAHYHVQSGREIRTECLPALRAAGLDPDDETVVLLMNMSNWDEAERRISQNSPYYASGTHRSGTAWQVDSPILEVESLGDPGNHVQDGQYGRISLGRYNSIFIGGIAHELGHALGLPHNRERPDEREAFGTALMGSGNRTYGEERRGEGKGSFLTLAHGLRLAAHPLFSGSIKQMRTRPQIELTDVELLSGDQSFTFTARVSSSLPVYAVVGYLDPEGGGDYDATTSVAVPDAEGRFNLHARPLPRDRSGEFRVVPLCVNGAAVSYSSAGSPFAYAFRTTLGGQPDLEVTQLRLKLQPVIAALNRGEPEAFDAAMQAVVVERAADSRFREVVDSLRALARRETQQSLTAVTNAVFPLSRAMPAEARVGWLRPDYDRLPDERVLLSAGGELFARGIYAHAPARHVYALDGRWHRLTGKVGLADGNSGSVVFIVEVDGQERWRSGLIREGRARDFDVSIQNGRELVLRVEDGGDGNRSDWGLWLDPLLISTGSGE